MKERGTADVEVHPAVEETAHQIAEMEVRGAAKIAETAASALKQQAEASTATTAETFEQEMRLAARVLLDTRPTAVSLPNSLRYIFRRIDGESVDELRESVITGTRAFQNQLASAQEELGGIGANRLQDGDTVLFHCHSTDVLSCVAAAREQGKSIRAIVKETRPRNQGYITARELRELDVPVTLIVDGAAGRYLEEADHVFVGADSVTADGAVVNKIGTRPLAVSARERDTPVVVAAQTVKLDPTTLSGHAVEIEMREESEVIAADEREDIGDIAVENPAFDVTPPRYVDAIVTERGQFPPESIVFLMRELFGTQSDQPWEQQE